MIVTDPPIPVAEGAPVCDLDPEVFNLHTAWWYAHYRKWMAAKHGKGCDWDSMVACGCGVCLEVVTRHEAVLAEARRRREPPPPPEPEEPWTIDATDTKDHVRELLDSGWTRTDIAAAAAIDKTTITRLLRDDVRNVKPATAEALQGVS